MYNEIQKLNKMLIDMGIPHEFRPMFDGYYLKVFNNEGDVLCDAIEHQGSLGSQKDLIEIFNATTRKEGDVLGYITADEAFKRFKYCWLNNTVFYKEEK